MDKDCEESRAERGNPRSSGLTWQAGIKRSLTFTGLTAILPVCAGIALSLFVSDA